MPNPPAPKAERAFCTNCGFPLRGSRCDACGSAQEAAPARESVDDVPTKQAQFRPYAPDLEIDMAGLDRAVEAHRAKDTGRFIEQLVVAEGAGTARTAHSPEGAAWIVTVRGSVLFVTLRAPQDELVIEAPIARLPLRQRLPAMRLALELSSRDAGGARVALRGDLLLLRFSARASVITPAILRHTLRQIGHLASRYSGLFVVGLDALPAIGEDQRASAGFEILGRAKKVQIGPGGVRRSIPPPVAPVPLSPAHPDPPRPAPPQQPRPNASPRARREESVPDLSGEPIPAVLSPAFSSAPQPPATPAVPPPPPAPQMPVALAPPAPQAAPNPGAFQAPDARSTRTNTTQTGTIPEPRKDVDSTGDKSASRKPDPGSSPGNTGAPVLPPSDRLCMLLRQAQSLVSIAMEARPASVSWLVRSTVFRAVYDFKDAVPDAVTHLYRCTGASRDAGAPRTASTQFPEPEPALHVMERVVVARGQMPKEKPLALEPMVTAAQAKEHVARYLAEIDRGPGDPAIRHFLALGALTELLVRTKLPPQTDQRLRDIVAHAQREGAKGTAIDLMMTALQRINA